MNPFGTRHSLGLLLLLGTPAIAAQSDQPTTTVTSKTEQTMVATPGQTTTTTTTREKVVETGKRAGEIATQPVRDVGAQKIDIPVPIQQAAAAPYSLAGLRTCAQLNQAIFGVLIVLFLVLEPRGLAAVWLRLKAYVKSWPFSY